MRISMQVQYVRYCASQDKTEISGPYKMLLTGGKLPKGTVIPLLNSGSLHYRIDIFSVSWSIHKIYGALGGGHNDNMPTSKLCQLFLCLWQSWARAFFYASRLRFRALGRSSSRWRFRALFWALNLALLLSRSRASRFFAFFRVLRFFALLHLRSSIFALVISCSGV